MKRFSNSRWTIHWTNTHVPYNLTEESVNNTDYLGHSRVGGPGISNWSFPFHNITWSYNYHRLLLAFGIFKSPENMKSYCLKSPKTTLDTLADYWLKLKVILSPHFMCNNVNGVKEVVNACRFSKTTSHTEWNYLSTLPKISYSIWDLFPQNKRQVTNFIFKLLPDSCCLDCKL